MSSKETPKTPPRVAKRNPALPEVPPDHPRLPGIEPAKPTPRLDPETAEMLERMRRTLDAATARMALPVPQRPQEIVLSPALLKVIEQRAVERVVHPLLQTVQELREAVVEARALRVEVQQLGTTARQELQGIRDGAENAARLLGGETRRQIEDLHTDARKRMRALAGRTLRWHQGLTWHTKTRLREVGASAVSEMRASTRSARKVADQLGVTVSTLEACADAVLYVAPAMTQHHEVRTRAIVRSGSLTTVGLIFAGLAILAAVLRWAGHLP